MIRYAAPLLVFALLVGFLYVGLGLNPREVPSPLVGKPAPDFQLPRLDAPAQTLSPAQMRGKVWLLNVWASWCVSCLQEHPVLVDLAKRGVAPIYGLNYKDKDDEARAWLARHGDPYTASVVDAQGRVGIDFGVYGVPETFVIDRDGVIRHKHIGPITPEALEQTIVPLIRRLQG